MHELCLMKYKLAILDTAFLIHRPGKGSSTLGGGVTKDFVTTTLVLKSVTMAGEDIKVDKRLRDIIYG